MKHALSGRVVTMDPQRRIIEDGVVYLDDRTIAAACERGEPAPPGFEAITPLPARGTIFPGLIELHNHVSYNLLPLWQVDRKYTNRNQWSSTESYRAQVTGPMKVIGNTPELLPALARYVECKCLLAGVTTTQGVALFSNSGVRRYYRGLVRNVEQSLDDDLPAASARIADVEKADAERFHARLRKETCLLLHLSEGTDDAALSHFRELQLSSGWAITRALAGIHCVALGASHFEVIAKQGASMVWSPLSNLLLYGRTADVLAARKAGVRMGIGSDWSYTGSKNLLGELRVARACAAGRIPTRDLVAMATCEAAEILGWSRLLGSIEAGKRADLIVVAGSKGDPYDSLTTADERAIRLVVIDGIARCGTVSMSSLLRVGATSRGRADGWSERCSTDGAGCRHVVRRAQLVSRARSRCSSNLRRERRGRQAQLAESSGRPRMPEALSTVSSLQSAPLCALASGGTLSSASVCACRPAPRRPVGQFRALFWGPRRSRGRIRQGASSSPSRSGCRWRDESRLHRGATRLPSCAPARSRRTDLSRPPMLS